MRLAGLSLLVLLACSGKERGSLEDELVDEASDALALESDVQAVTSALVTSGSTSPDLGVDEKQYSRACVTIETIEKTAISGTLAYHFRACNGTYGVVDGDIQVHYGILGAVLHFDLDAKSLGVGATKLGAWSASADVVASGWDRTMIWRGHIDGTTATQRHFVRDNSYTIHWRVPELCVDIDGHSHGSVVTNGAEKSFDMSLVNFRKCARVCPRAGSEIHVRRSDGFGVTIKFQTLDRAIFTNTSGQTFPFRPDCAN